MKRMTPLVFACVLAAPGMLSGALYAQDSGANAGSLASQGQAPSDAKDQARQGRFAKKLKEDLGLTDDQIATLQAALKDKREAMKTTGQALKADMEALSDQVKNSAADKDIQATLDKVKQDRDAMAAAMKDAEAKFEAATSFLTPTQRAKMLLGQMRQMRKRWHGGDDGGHGHWQDKDSDQ